MERGLLSPPPNIDGTSVERNCPEMMERRVYRRLRGPRLSDPFVLLAAGCTALGAWLTVEAIRLVVGPADGRGSLLETLLAAALFWAGAALFGSIIRRHRRNIAEGVPALSIDATGLGAQDLLGKPSHLPWADILEWRMEEKRGAPVLWVRSRKFGIGSVELRDTDADPATVVRDLEAFSGRRAG